jgi:hypothetical protein
VDVTEQLSCRGQLPATAAGGHVAEQRPPSEVSAPVCVMEELVDKLGIPKINSSCVNDRSAASLCRFKRGPVNSVAIKQEYDGC